MYRATAGGEELRQTIVAAKEFLDAALAKCETLKQAGDFASLITDESNFQQLKQRGVGRETLQKFLGGNWSTLVEFSQGLFDFEIDL